MSSPQCCSNPPILNSRSGEGHHVEKLGVLDSYVSGSPNSKLAVILIDYFVKIYPGVRHGWTVRYNAQDEAACKPADEAQKDLLEWFTKHVK